MWSYPSSKGGEPEQALVPIPPLKQTNKQTNKQKSWHRSKGIRASDSITCLPLYKTLSVVIYRWNNRAASSPTTINANSIV